MTSGKRFALLAALVVIAITGFILIKPDDDSGDNSLSTTATTAPEPSGTGKTAPAKPAPPPVPEIRLRDGKPVGGVKELEFTKGDRIQFDVTADVADEVHVHGYELKRDVEPGKTVNFSFKGDIDGQFEVELEQRTEQIAELKVTP